MEILCQRRRKPTSIANPTDKKEPPTKGPSLTGAVAVAISHNQADAIVGDGAKIVVHGGDMTVEGYTEENIKANVNAHVNKPSESVSGAAAVFVGDYNNTANAAIGDNTVVDVTGMLLVKANSKIPNQIVLDDDWQGFKDKVNGLSPWTAGPDRSPASAWAIRWHLPPGKSRPPLRWNRGADHPEDQGRDNRRRAAEGHTVCPATHHRGQNYLTGLTDSGRRRTPN